MSPLEGSGPAGSRHARVKQLFLDALDVPRGRRAAFIAEASGDDDALRREVLELFLLHGEQDSVLDAPLDGSEALAGLGTPATGSIGPWRLVRELGRGGMGVVHLAERDGRLAAVKVLATGAVSPEVRERFRLEADILHRLDHPGIARVLDEGEMTGAGGVPQPWIAMEFVEGRTLLEHAERAGLPVRARLELLAAVCDAVQHAHAHGIVHRDLKPSNILVRGAGLPVVLDFGVARLTAGDERPTEFATRTGQLVGTPQYMSPEQVQAEPSAIGPASDVYSLGIIAYELLAGRLPYMASSLSLHRAVVTILTVDPPPLGQAAPELRGALERIVGKALEKAPELRYADAGELAEDLRRHLEGRTVRARGPSLARRVQRWSRGRRRFVATALVVAGAALLVAAWALGGGQALSRARSLANYREAERLFIQGRPLLYEGERTPQRLQQAVDVFSRARTLIEAVPPLAHHDVLVRLVEKELGTAQYLLGELTWDVAPTRSAATSLTHALTLSADTAGMLAHVQAAELADLHVPRGTLLGLLCGANLALNRQWGQPATIRKAMELALESLAENIRLRGPALPPGALPPEVMAHDGFGYCYNTLAQVGTDLAAFSGAVEDARRAVLWSDSAMMRSSVFRENWPAMGSVLFERGRAYRTLGALTHSSALLDTAEHYLIACSDFRGPERPWVFAETQQERARLALDRLHVDPPSWVRSQRLGEAHVGLDSALFVLRSSGLTPVTSAVIRAADAELLAELALATHWPTLLDSADARLQSALPLLPATSVPRQAGLGWISKAAVQRVRFELAWPPIFSKERAWNALDRASIIAAEHDDSMLVHRVAAERERCERAVGRR